MRLDPDVVNDLRGEFTDLDDESILELLIDTYHRSKTLEVENRQLLERTSTLEQELEEATVSLRQLMKEKEATDRHCENLKRRYHKLRSKQENASPTPVIREKVVYREDNSAVEALRAKCNDLRERLWEYQQREGEIKPKLERLRALEARDEDWRTTYHGIIIRTKNGTAIPDLNITLIDSKDYFKNRFDPEAFKEEHHLVGPFWVKELPYGR